MINALKTLLKNTEIFYNMHFYSDNAIMIAVSKFIKIKISKPF